MIFVEEMPIVTLDRSKRSSEHALTQEDVAVGIVVSRSVICAIEGLFRAIIDARYTGSSEIKA